MSRLFRQIAANDLQYALKIARDRFGSNTDDSNVERLQNLLPVGVSHLLFNRVMHRAIDFDREPLPCTVEIQDERAEWLLPTKLQSLEPPVS